MKSMADRQIMANQLAHLRQRLLSYDEWILKTIPADLQQQIRSFVALEPITSSGLESVHTIIERIDWAIYYLNDPGFPENQKKSPTAEAMGDKPVKINLTKQTEQPASPAQQSKPLDFGPFDPRAGSNGTRAL